MTNRLLECTSVLHLYIDYLSCLYMYQFNHHK